MGKAQMTQRQEAFKEAYLSNNGNATQAAIDAGYSPKTARQIGQRLLSNVDIAAEIARRRAEINARLQEHTQISRQELLDMMLVEARGERVYKQRNTDGGTVVEVERRSTSPSARVGAISKLGQELHDMFIDKSKQELDVRVLTDRFVGALSVLDADARRAALDEWERLAGEG
jgi:phage terminase small subunit